MKNITFISTVHKDTGKCNADELYKIIQKLSPEVVFLEALVETYSKYQESNFSNFCSYHDRVEIAAIKRYSINNSFKYNPVLDKGLPESFERKYNLVCEYIELQQMGDHFNHFAGMNGFEFLNSVECEILQENMRKLEDISLNNIEEEKIVNADIDEYENQVFRNIYSYCSNNDFSSAAFMCGAAHRKSII